MKDDKSTIPEQEDQHTEFKESWDKKKCLQAICGFANAEGGSLYLGVKDGGKIKGIDLPPDRQKYIDSLSNKINHALRFRPKDINIRQVKRENLPTKPNNVLPLISENTKNRQEQKKFIVHIEIEPSHYTAIKYEECCWQRQGAHTVQLKGEKLRNFLKEKDNRSWDDFTWPGVSITDLDVGVKLFCEKMPSPPLVSLDTENLLDKLELIRDGKINRAAFLLFHKNPFDKEQPFIKNGFIKIIIKDPSFSQDLKSGSLFSLIDKVVKMYSEHLHNMEKNSVVADKSAVKSADYKTQPKKSSRFISSKPASRPAGSEQGRKSLREALYAAVILADYSLSNPFEIEFCKNTFQLKIPAKVNKGNTENQETATDRQKRRESIKKQAEHFMNPNLARVFKEIGFDIEEWIETSCNSETADLCLTISSKGFEIRNGEHKETFRDKIFKFVSSLIELLKQPAVFVPVIVVGMFSFFFVTVFFWKSLDSSIRNFQVEVSEKIISLEDSQVKVLEKIADLKNESIDKEKVKQLIGKKDNDNPSRSEANIDPENKSIHVNPGDPPLDTSPSIKRKHLKFFFGICLEKDKDKDYERCLKRIKNNFNRGEPPAS